MAVSITIFFWGNLVNTIAMLFGNMWIGIGGCLLIWLATDSTWGDKYLRGWNLFSYTFRDLEKNGDILWLYGKNAMYLYRSNFDNGITKNN